MHVLKFGGTSVADATNISKVIDIVLAAAVKDRVILVCSAISGCTDKLIAVGKAEGAARESIIEDIARSHHAIARRLFSGVERALADEQTDAALDELSCAAPDECVTFGELLSTRIIARKIAGEGVSTEWIDSRELIRTCGGVLDTAYTYAHIAEAVAATDARVIVAPGFIASDENGRVTTLGRGGSDYSAAIYAAAIHADTLEIWTDVPGIMTTNPKDVPAAYTIPEISYDAVFCMAAHGAKVLYAPTVMPAREAGIAINIRDTFDPGHPGTMIRSLQGAGEWRGLAVTKAADRSELCLVAEGVVDEAAATARVLKVLQAAGIDADGFRTEPGCLLFCVSPEATRRASLAIHSEFFETEADKARKSYIDEDYLSLLRQMMEIDSTSGSERAMAEWLLEHLEAPRKEAMEVGDGTLNLLFCWGEPKVVFCTHMDTVPPYLPPVISEDRVSGRGSCDAKGPMLAMYVACRQLEAEGKDGFALLLLSGEETGSWGAKAFAKTEFRAPNLVLGSATDNLLVSASKGTKSFDLKFTGEAFHSGYPQYGRSAVELFLDFMAELEHADFMRDKLLGDTTYNIGLLRSDNPQNILSPSLTCRLYFRTTFASDSQVVSWMTEYHHPGLTVTPRGGDTPAEYFVPEGFESRPVAFGNDAAHLSNFTNKMICGPGNIRVVHRDDEHILIADLDKAIQNYIDIYESCN